MGSMSAYIEWRFVDAFYGIGRLQTLRNASTKRNSEHTPMLAWARLGFVDAIWTMGLSLGFETGNSWCDGVTRWT